MTTPKIGVAYKFTIGLLDSTNVGRIKLTPTIAVGDFKVSVDEGALTNVTNLPTESPAGSGLVVVSLTGPEVGSKTVVRWSDPQFEWGDGSYFFDAPAATIEDAARQTQMTEGYAADGVAPTMEQALFFLLSALTEFSILGTIITAKKLDGVTTAATFTLNDPTNPTSRTRTA